MFDTNGTICIDYIVHVSKNITFYFSQIFLICGWLKVEGRLYS